MNKLVTEEQILHNFIYIEVSIIVKLTEEENMTVVARAGGGDGNGELFNECEVPVLLEEQVMETCCATS